MRRLILVAILCFGLVGCEFLAPIGLIAQIGIYWMNREAHKYYATSMDEMDTAVRYALDELDMPIEEEYMDGEVKVFQVDASDIASNTAFAEIERTEGEETSASNANVYFRIRLEQSRNNVTEVSILVNTLGDKPYAEMIYRHIDNAPNVEQYTSVEELQAALDEKPSRRR